MNQTQSTGEPPGAGERNHWRKLESYARWLNIITASAAIIALGALVVLVCTLREATTATEAANRAWMSVQPPAFPEAPNIGQPVSVTFAFTNYGREPAIDLMVLVHFDVISAPQSGSMTDTEYVDDNICKADITPSMKNSVAPPSGAVFPTTKTNVGGNNIVWNDALNSGHNILRVKGCLSYLAFDKRRYTWFCRVFTYSFPNDPKKIGGNCNGGDGAT